MNGIPIPKKNKAIKLPTIQSFALKVSFKNTAATVKMKFGPFISRLNIKKGSYDSVCSLLKK